jgi:hypothetical protein
MKLSVTKALRLRSAIEEKLKSFDLKATVELDVDSKRVQNNPADVIAEAAAGLSARLETFARLSAFLAKARIAIAKENVESGVEEILAAQGNIDRQIAKLKQVVAAPRVDLDSIENKIARRFQSLKSPAPSAGFYGHSAETATLSINTVTEAVAADLEKQLVGLRRAKAELDESRAVANARAEIEIGEDDHRLLIEQGIV